MDINNSGFIETSEVENLLNHLLNDGQSGVSKTEVLAVMSRIDTNSDGRISFDEFVRLMVPMLEESNEADWEGSFQRFKEERELVKGIVNFPWFVHLTCCSFVEMQVKLIFKGLIWMS